MRDIWKKIVLVFTVCIFVCMQTITVSAASTGSTVSRAEWIHDLVTTFDMTIEDGLMPDDYYTDITESEYYNDILLAVNFGVIDLEAGEQFCPDDPVTREFAVQTLNACLGYELDEETEYTMSDYADLQYPQAAQIAVNEEWLKLVNGAFEPEKTITATEKNNMLNFAKEILAATVVDEDHENVYEFADNIIEIPKETSVELLSPTEIMIYDTSLKLSEGDSIAVYSNGIAYTYKIIELKEQAEGIRITGEEIAYEDAVVSVDAEGIIDADLANFVPADGVTVYTEYEEAAATYELGRIGGTQKVKDIVVKKNIGGGTASCKLTNMKIHYRINSKGYKFSVTGTAVASYTISGKKDFTLTLGYISIDGVGKVSVDMIYSADGSATLSYSYNFETGIEKDYGSPTRKIKEYSTPSWHFSAKAQLKTCCKVGFYVNVPGAANGSIYGEAGVKAEPDVEVYGDGKKPTTCMDLPAYIFATVGYNLTVLNKNVAGETIEIYNHNNSPCRVCYHIEDGKQVSTCSRPESSSRVGKRGYYSVGDAGSGTYSANCFVAPYADAVQPTFEYELDEDDNATITKYNGSVAYLTIPEELDGYSVKKIGSSSFSENKYVKKVIIPDSVRIIDGNAFKNCNALKEAVLPTKLESIGCGAFQNCIALTDVNIPVALDTGYMGANYMYPGAFQGCTSLKTVCFDNGISKIPSGLFYNCTGLESLVFPNTITTIEGNAFLNCNQLSNVQFSECLTTIDNNAFQNCTALVKIELPECLSNLNSGAFQGCINLKEVNIPAELSTGYMAANYMYPGAFNGCSSLETVKFESGITTIPNGLFYGCTGLKSVIIPDTVIEIKEKAFLQCTSLDEVYIPDSVKDMGTYIFSGCSSLRKVHLPNIRINVTEGTFQNCASLTEVNFPDTLETIGTNAFKNCTSLSEVNLPEEVNTINSSAFYGCTSLVKMTIPASMRTINSSSFSHCEALTDLNIAEGTTSIGEKAFEYCVGLEKVVLPDTMQSLGNYAFSYCDKLSNAGIGAGIKVIPNYCFYEDPALVKVVLPQQVTIINKYAFANCTGLTDITINRNVATIDATAFSYPDKLTIHGIVGTYAETFATDNSITFEALNVPATAIKLNKTELEIGRKETIQMTAAITPADSSDDFTWTSTDETIVSIDSTGRLTANALGTATIIAMAGDIIETCEVSVYEPVTSVSINKSSYTGTIGDTLQLASTIRPSNATYPSVQWTSSNTEVAEVTNTGLVTLKKYGKATITVRTDNKGKTATCAITVQPIAVTGVSLDWKMQTLGIGESCLLTATITPDNASVKDVTWTSSKPAVATVENGKVTAISEGTTVIIVKTKDGSKTASCTVTVKNVPVTGISLNKTNLEMETKTTATISANILPADATNTIVTWQSDNEDVASVVNGKITAKKAGMATITVVTQDGNFSASCVVTVTGHGVTGVELSKESISIEEGNCTLLEVIITPENADDPSVTWQVDDEAIATVDTATGIVEGVQPGTTSIKVITTDGGYEAVCEVEVTAADDSTEKIEVSEVNIQTDSEDLSDDNKIEIGKEFTLNAIVQPADATNSNIIWISSDKNIASISQEGVVTTKGIGEVTFTAVSESGAKQAELTVEVIPIAVTGVDLDSHEMEMIIGEKGKLTVSLTPANATNQEISWSSSRRSIVSVDAEGNIKANAVGTATITVTTADGEYKDSCVITINPVLVSNIELDAKTLEMKVGDKKKINATVLPQSATDKTIVWSSSNTKVLNVDQNGNVSAIGAGSANIVAMSADGSEVKAQCTVNVSEEEKTTQQPTTEPVTTEQVKTESTLLVVGTQVTVGNGIYKVTKSTSSQKEVTYVKPKSKNKTSVSISDTIKISGFTYKVTSVASNALAGNKKVTKVTVGKNVTSIGKNAFKKCTKLKTVILKSTSLKSIGSNAFYGDKNLKNITIKSSKLTSISVGKNAFKGTNKKLTIKVPKKKVSSYKKFLKKKGNTKITVKKG